MKDFDFEELDRAVNSAIGSEEDNEVLSALEEPPVDDRITVNIRRKQPDAHEVHHSHSHTHSEAKPQPAATPATRRSSGKFMDLVHPTSENRRPTRIGAAPVVAAETPAPAVIEKDPNDQPDPLDFHGFQDEDSEEDAPLESPFIANAVVEKQPLGSTLPTGDAAKDTETSPLLREPDHELLDEGEEVPRLEAETDDVGPMTPSTIVNNGVTRDQGEQPANALYDTDTHPVSAPVKKKSAIWTVLWIFSLIVVGGGIGAAVYYFVLPLI